MLLRLDVLREYIRDLLGDTYTQEQDAERLVRNWAGFLKHPRGFALAHRCDFEWEDAEGILRLDNEAVKEFGRIRQNDDKDRAKEKYRNNPVEVILPTVDEIESFFKVCQNRMQAAIEKYR
ncbi:hypothetical protein A7A09_016565 [Paracoccus methylarcula]|uniref:Uncharacterized protein n=2 Tax=Paracoccus methylarcula TaxID=72022 RepID=A0A422QUA0_9RHOB|nr:hypothetical protein A7A09_016565 [Paracoccus methylarcula]